MNSKGFDCTDNNIENMKELLTNKMSGILNITVQIVGKKILWFANNILIFCKDFSYEMKEFLPFLKVSPIESKKIPKNNGSNKPSVHMKFTEMNEKTFVSPLSNFYFKFENMHKLKYENDCINTNKLWSKCLWKPVFFILPDVNNNSDNNVDVPGTSTHDLVSTKMNTHVNVNNNNMANNTNDTNYLNHSIIKKKMVPSIIPQSSNEIVIKYNKYHNTYGHIEYEDQFANTLFVSPNIQIKSEPINITYYMYCKNLQGKKCKLLCMENIKNIRTISIKNYYGFINLCNQYKHNEKPTSSSMEQKNSNNNVSYSHHNMYQVQQKPYSKIFDTRKNVESENSNNKADSILKQHLNRIINKSEDLRINNKGTLDICNKLLLSNECKTNEKKKKTGSNNIGSIVYL